MSSVLNPVTVDTRCGLARQLAMSCSLAAIEIDVFKVEGVDVAGDVAEQREANVHAEVSAAACHHCNSNRRDYTILLATTP